MPTSTRDARDLLTLQPPLLPGQRRRRLVGCLDVGRKRGHAGRRRTAAQSNARAAPRPRSRPPARPRRRETWAARRTAVARSMPVGGLPPARRCLRVAAQRAPRRPRVLGRRACARGDERALGRRHPSRPLQGKATAGVRLRGLELGRRALLVRRVEHAPARRQGAPPAVHRLGHQGRRHVVRGRGRDHAGGGRGMPASVATQGPSCRLEFF